MDNFVIITQDGCRFCDLAKRALKQHGHEWTEFNLSDHPSLKDFVKASGLATVPQIYRDGYRIGGFESLTQFLALPQPS